MGPIGWPETVFIFFLALILFGPRKLPELGRTVGKAWAEFQRVKGEMKDAFDREAKQLALDTDMLTSVANRHRIELGAIDASSYGSIRTFAPGTDESVLQSVSPRGAATHGSETEPKAMAHVG